MAIVVLVLLFPGTAARSTFAVVPLNGTMSFTGSDSVAATTVSGDVHLNVTGSWAASAPTWQVWWLSEAYSTPLCYPYCGNASTQGVVDISEDFCTNWGGGATSYGSGPTLTVYLGFVTGPAAVDLVEFNVTVTTAPSTACA